MESLVDTKPERRELIEALDVVFWDEAMSNHRECLEAVMMKFDNLKGKKRFHVDHGQYVRFDEMLHVCIHVFRQSFDNDA